MANVELILGPAGAGKTERVRCVMQAELVARQAEGRFGTTLWITPTGRSRRQVLRSLMSASLPVCFQPQVLTFAAFAEGLLRTAPVAVRPLSRSARRKLLRDLIDDLNRRGQLNYFGKVAHTAGFLELCESFISELKREEIWPEHFEQACRPEEEPATDPEPRASTRDREMVSIYAAYQQRLHAAGDGEADRDAIAGLYDGEGMFWSARTLMAAGHRGPYRELTLVVVDGFTDFTRTQYEMLATLADWTDRMHVTLPIDASGRRAELFTKSSAARSELKRSFAAHALTEIALEPPAEVARRPFGHLSMHLFDNPRELPRLSDATGLSVLACVRRSGEIETIARRIKQLLVQGVRPDEIVVVRRSLDGAADLFRRTFADAGIPAIVDAGRSIASTGLVKFLLSLLDLERDDWPFVRLKSVLNCSLLRPEWPELADGATAVAVVAALRALNLDSGRELMLSVIARRLERSFDGSGKQTLRGDFESASALLRRLSNELSLLRERATYSGWVDRILALATNLKFESVLKALEEVDESLASAEQPGWKAFVGLAEESKKAAALIGSPPRAIHLADFRRQLGELLAGQTWDGNEHGDGKVRVLSADQVRNLDVPHLFVSGMNESEFPQSRGDDCLYGDAERYRFSERGVPLSHRARHSREEMLLFYGVVTRARSSLTLSFASVDDDGEPLNPSPYLTAVCDLFKSEVLSTESCGWLDPVPERLDQCLTESDLRLIATRDALDEGNAGLLASLAGRPQSTGSVQNLAAAAEMAAARFATRGLTNYEGLLSHPVNLKRLRKRFGSKHEFSVSALETYTAHPFRFFLTAVLGLEPLADPGPGTDHSRRGMTFHSALAALHRRFASDATLSVTGDALNEGLRTTIAELALQGGDSPLQRALRAIEREILTKQAGRYGSQWESYVAAMQPHWDALPLPKHFEVPFGNPPREEGDEDSERHQLVEFGPKGERVFVQGRIDRIDIGQVGGESVYNVIDYKLRRDPAAFDLDALETGRSLQLAVYACVARRMNLVDADLFQIGYWSIKGDGFVAGYKAGRKRLDRIDAELAESFDTILDRLLPQLVEQIRGGRFNVVTDDPEQRYNADCVAVARSTQFRAVAESLGKVEELRDES